MRVALDAMGGDAGPGPIVAGAAQAVRAEKQLRVVLVGDLTQLEQCLSACQGHHARLTIFHASQHIHENEAPGPSLRLKPDSTIARCWQLWAERKVEVIVSTGNPEACAAAGLRLQRFLPPVRKPGMAAVIPTLTGQAVLIDVAANHTPAPAHLYQYGVMGTIYAQQILEKPRPTIALLSAGTEAAARHERTHETSKLFRNSPLSEQFIGSIEGQEVHRGAADVIVTDAFVGRMLLGMWAGIAELAEKLSAAPLRREPRPIVGPFLGIDGVCFSCHAMVNEKAIEQTVGLVLRYVAAGVNELMVQQLHNGPLVSGV